MFCSPNLMVKRKIHLSILENSFMKTFIVIKLGKSSFSENLLLAISSCILVVILGIRISPFITFYFKIYKILIIISRMRNY